MIEVTIRNEYSGEGATYLSQQIEQVSSKAIRVIDDGCHDSPQAIALWIEANPSGLLVWIMHKGCRGGEAWPYNDLYYKRVYKALAKLKAKALAKATKSV